MKKVKYPIRHKGSGELIGSVEMNTNIDDIMFAIEDEIDKKEIHEEILVCPVCQSDICLCEGGHCYTCGGEGIIITCPDDLCHIGNGCMHGDGEVECPDCHGEGVVYPKMIPLSKLFIMGFNHDTNTKE